ncbi:hypothetical protein [Cupriavidus pauculus]|uniref:hypothetical protein n=1 Tax=Cupriavidus pauculus TaxID=82633 RepID=UPI001EE22587|nr:hypothetical protein [Cupriavidus pauculus]GJG96837.1 hypothetical protein CBA19C6_20130 [Cupriavidus pauculus]
MINLKRLVLNVRAFVVDCGAIFLAACALLMFTREVVGGHRYAIRTNPPVDYSVGVIERVAALRAWEAQLHPLLPNTVDHVLFGAWCAAVGVFVWIAVVCIDHVTGHERAGRLATSVVGALAAAIALAVLSRLVYSQADWAIALLAVVLILAVGISNWDVVRSARERPSAFVFVVGVFLWLRYGVGWEVHQWLVDDPKKEGTVRQLAASASAFSLVVGFSCFLGKAVSRLDAIDRPSGILRRTESK